MRKTTKCYIYIRVSTTMQVEGYSLDAQRDKLRKYAEYQEMQIVREYADEGKSGKNMQGRPAFTQMLEDIKNDKDGVSFVLVFKLSRFGRNAADVLSSLQLMQDNDVNLICVEDGIDSSKDAGKLMISVLSAVAEIERENIRTQTMEGRRQKAREGKWNGGFAPYGYKINNGILEVVEEEAEAIRIIYDKFVNTDLGYNGVAKYLAQKGIKKIIRQNGKLAQFSETFVKNALDNEAYMGKIAYGKRTNQKIKGEREEYHIVKSDSYMLVDGLHEAIVSEELWQQAHKKRQETAMRLSKKHDLEHEHLLTGIVKCPVCGKGLVANISRKRKSSGELRPTSFLYYCNHSRPSSGHTCTYRKQWTQHLIDDAVAEVIKKMVVNPKFAAAIQEKIDAKLDTREQEQDVENARKQVKQAEGIKNAIINQIDSLDVLSQTYQMKYDDLQDRLDDAYEKLKEAKDYLEECELRLENLKADKLLSKSIYQYLMMFDKVYDMMTDMEKKQFYNNFIDEIQIHEDAQRGEQILKSIDFKMPIYYNGQETTHIGWDRQSHDETVCILSKLSSAKEHIEVTVDMDELDLTSAEAKATYKEIQEWVQEKYGFHVTNLNIAQVKQKHGIIERENYNKPKSPDSKQPGCPEEKVKAIEDAMRHFQIHYMSLCLSFLFPR